MRSWGGARLGAGGPKRHLHLSKVAATVLDRLMRFELAHGRATTPETIVENLIYREVDARIADTASSVQESPDDGSGQQA